jgi:ABC-2 type transport system ATP-binding protein
LSAEATSAPEARSGAPAPEARSATPALLQAEDARIAIDDVVAIDRLTLTTQGSRVLFLGDVEALFAALTGVSFAARAQRAGASDDDLPGEARVTAGSLRVAGRDVATGAHIATTGIAPLDPPLPASWTAEEYVAWSARLAGASARAARELAGAALAKVNLRRLGRRGCTSLSPPERRALLLAHAVVMSPEVLIVEAPLSGLSGAAADFVIAAIAGATEGRGAIISGSKLDPSAPESALSRGATYVVVIIGGSVALEGRPGELFSGATVYGLTVRSNAEPFRAELASRGIELRGGPLRFSASLPEGATTREIIAAAKTAKAVLIEFVPLI